MSNIFNKIKDKNFLYEKPWLYRNNLALRCDISHIYNMKYKEIINRCLEIFDFIFRDNQVDYIFYHKYQYKNYLINYPIIKNVINNEFDLEIKELLKEKDYEGIKSIKRSIVYNTNELDFKEIIASQIINVHESRIHMVSLENKCIFSISDYRACEIVFFDEGKYKEFYLKLEDYFMDYDRSYMKKIYDSLES